MSIIYNQNKNIFTLHTKNTTYQMQVDKYGYLLHLYYGARNFGFADDMLTFADRGFSGNPYAAGNDKTYSLDTLPQEYPTLGSGDYRNYALNIENSDGSRCCNLTFSRYEIRQGKYSLKGLPAVWSGEDAKTLEIVLKDRVSQVEVSLLYGVLEEEDIITRSAVIRNVGEHKVTLKKASGACLDFLTGDFDVVKFYGRHTMERNMERTPLGHGTTAFGSRRGMSSHQYNPAVILADRDATEDFGSCYGMLFVYSGNFLCEVEKDQIDQTRVIMGLGSALFSYPLEVGQEFFVPEVILSYSQNGFAELSHKYHSCIRNHVCRGKYANRPRPVLLNSWEAAYFDFNGDTIVNLAKEAADLGMDMVVMDDGWFGKRDDDKSSLGDWYVNEEKLGGTLAELIHRVNSCGVKFGIWIEPEMISEDSDLYRAHPDWCLKVPGRNPMTSRGQLNLDVSRKEVRDYVMGQIFQVLDACHVEYVKWDVNRAVSNVYSLSLPDDRQGEVLHRHMLGVYDMMEQLVSRYPNLLLETCAGGGGRFDAGMLYYSPQIWCSDNTDAIDRLEIQYGTSFIYPISAMGAHISVCPNHQTGRTTPMDTRAAVAMSGTFGYELDLEHMSKEEKELASAQIADFKEIEPLIQTGDYYRITAPGDENNAVIWSFVSKDQGQALVLGVIPRKYANPPITLIRLRGLDPKMLYEEKITGHIYTGAVLMYAGIPLPVPEMDYQAVRFEFVKKS